MQPSSELDPIVATALQKLGRNVVNFQKMEGMLKFILLFSDLEGSPSIIQRNFASRLRRLKKRTMGSLVEESAKSLFVKPAEHSQSIAPAITEITVRHTIRLAGGAEGMKAWRKQMRKVVRERNYLVHEMAVKFDKNSTENCLKLSEGLDAQRERMLGTYGELEALVKEIRHHLQELQRGNFEIYPET
jgi:hypothetical protein